ncbi:hypothetical protein [Croceicoccus sp. Ery15]|uniref:hypothetical protein n=1 Tax=Croceicoccus sp. Ery15 TaxID=1703338 RepID=UPI001E3A70A2|nr:hypothetical protein [Croceicoccus sp. Ery15]
MADRVPRSAGCPVDRPRSAIAAVYRLDLDDDISASARRTARNDRIACHQCIIITAIRLLLQCKKDGGRKRR